MFNRITRAITASVVMLSMLVGCVAPATLLPASGIIQAWHINRIEKQEASTVENAPVSAAKTAAPTQIEIVSAPKGERESVLTTYPIERNIIAANEVLGRQHSESTESPLIQKGSGVDFVSQQASSVATRAAESWLRQFGTVKLSAQGLSGQSKFGGSVDMLFPVVNTDKHVVFGQVGLRHTNTYTEAYRTTLNLGAGYRRFFDWYMLGGNIFFDQDITRQHERFGLGAELWFDNLKLAANAYRRVSDWKISPDLENYLERPANGWDIRAEGYLPSYPQLGGKLVYEKYYGDEVALFNVKERSRNPHALTAGLSYTPVPAISLGVDHRMGNGASNTSVSLNFKYALGVPLAKQFDSQNVAPSRKLDAMRLDLVDRNNEIVLEYKKDNRGSIKLPTQVAGYPAATISFPVSITFGTPGAAVVWSGSAAAFTDPYNGSGTGTMTLPAYNHAGINTYQLIASTVDNHGQPLVSNTMTVMVQPVTIKVVASKPVAVADGKEQVTFTAAMTGINGESLANHELRWATPSAATVVSKQNVTNTDGKAATVLRSVKAFQARVSATDVYGFESEASTIFRGDTTTSGVVSVVSTPSELLANGTDTGTLVATVLDANGNPVGAGITVNWSTDNGTLSSNTSVTRDDSTATVTLRSTTKPGAANVSAKTTTAGDPGASTSVRFIVDLSGAVVVELISDKAFTLADGTSTATLTATVQDAYGNLVGAGATVNWTTSVGTLSGSTSVTNADSKATITLTAPTSPGQANVQATASAVDPGKTVNVEFLHAVVAALTASKSYGLADGANTTTLTATVQDTSGNPVGAGIVVNWTTSLGQLSGSTSVTNAASQATVTLTAPTTAGKATVSAKAFTADPGRTADIDFAYAVVVSLTPSTTVAELNQAVGLTATVRDTLGHPVGAGITVSWTTNLGNLSASTTVTNASGIATNTLVSPSSSGTATVGSMTNANGTPVRTAVQILKPVTCKYEQRSGDLFTGYRYYDQDGHLTETWLVDGRAVNPAGYSKGALKYSEGGTGVPSNQGTWYAIYEYEICGRF